MASGKGHQINRNGKDSTRSKAANKGLILRDQNVIKTNDFPNHKFYSSLGSIKQSNRIESNRPIE